jgi:hypothetical protein
MTQEMTITTSWTDKDWNKFSKWLKDMLHVDVATVTFTKKDGTERVMKCTLKPEHLPTAPITENKKERKVNDNVLAVYDVEANGWRSFTIKSVTRVQFTIG